jgi:hypothetical protein
MMLAEDWQPTVLLCPNPDSQDERMTEISAHAPQNLSAPGSECEN